MKPFDNALVVDESIIANSIIVSIPYFEFINSFIQQMHFDNMSDLKKDELVRELVILTLEISLFRLFALKYDLLVAFVSCVWQSLSTKFSRANKPPVLTNSTIHSLLEFLSFRFNLVKTLKFAFSNKCIQKSGDECSKL